ncbi:MAG: subclass B1 metallo-beta-lactamase [Verrucomicrobiales bacterium]|nr:subclass B1 metallo-beta-lactamase [Verrucomicrobiales bacterium]
MNTYSKFHRTYLRVSIVSALIGWFSCAPNLVSGNEKVITLSDEVTVQKIDDDVWIHISFREVEGFGLVPANGLVIVSDGKGIAIDLPWTDGQTKTLFGWFRSEQGVEIELVIPTHSHDDCAGGLAEAHRQGADSWALKQTAEKLKEEEKEVPRNTFEKTKSLQRGETEVLLSYEGGGHTTDNIIAWLPAQKILFGGCAVKSLEAANIGYVKEADAKSWPIMLNGLLKNYPDAEKVVPGHGDAGGLDLVRHSIKMVNSGKKLGLFNRTTE